MWSLRAVQVVAQLIAKLPPERLDPTRAHAARLGALPIGGSMWADYYLRPNGDVVIVGEELDRPDIDSVYRDRPRVLFMLVWGAERYPQLAELIPAREPNATDCECAHHPGLFGPGRPICGTCGGVGWLPPNPG
jgi:hypothetical protein